MLNKEQYIAVLNTWKQKEEHTVQEHILYNVLRGKDSSDGFIALTDTGRLHASQDDPWYAHNSSVRELKYQLTITNEHWFELKTKQYSAEFGIEFTKELMAEIVSVLKLK